MVFAIIKIILGVVGIIVFSVLTYKFAKAPIENTRYDIISMGVKGGRKTGFLSGRTGRTGTGSMTSSTSGVLNNNGAAQAGINYEADTDLLGDDTDLLCNADDTSLLDGVNYADDTLLLDNEMYSDETDLLNNEQYNTYNNGYDNNYDNSYVNNDGYNNNYNENNYTDDTEMLTDETDLLV